MAFPVAYKYRASLTIVVRPSSTLTDFPVLLTKDNLPADIMDADATYRALEDGGDIRFSSDSAGATQLACEIVTFTQDNNPANAKVEIWVKLPSISSSADTTFYIWWGGPDTAQPGVTTTYGRNAVWSNGYVSNWHLKESTGAAVDSRGSNNGTYYGNLPNRQTGKVGYCQRLDGTGDHVTIANESNFDIAGNITLSGWFKVGSFTATWQAILAKADNTYRVARNGNNNYITFDRNDDTLGYSVGNTTPNVEDGNWHHFAAVFSTTSGMVLYVDGSANGTESSTANTAVNNDALQIGANGDGREFNGDLDEFSVANTARNSAWVGAAYASQNNPTTYITEGSVVVINQTVSPSGIASAQAFGTAKINRSIVMTGIASQQTFGALTVYRGNVSITGAGAIATVQAVGSPQVNLKIYPSGIASAQAFGTSSLNRMLIINGVVSGEAFGTAKINRSIVMTGIASGEAFGTPQLNLHISPVGIASGEVVSHQARIVMLVYNAGDIASEEAFGTCKLSYGIEPYGIPTAEIFGTAKLNLEIIVVGIASDENVGSPVVGNMMRPTGIASGEAFGTAVLTTGNVFITPVNITSTEAFGSISVRGMVYATGIPTAEASGVPSVNLTIHPNGLISQEGFGTAVMGVKIQPVGISSGESFSPPSLVQIISVPPIASLEAFGTVKLNLLVVPITIPSSEAFGLPSVIYIISPSGIASEEVFGSLMVLNNISVFGIGSGEWFGTPSFIQPQNISGAGAIAGSESFGQAIVFYDQIVTLSGIDSSELFGQPVLAVIRQNIFFDYVQNDLERGMLNTAEFGETGIYIYSNGSTLQLPGIFDNEYRTVDPDTGVGVMNAQPVYWCSTRQLVTKPGPRDKMRIRGVNYQVIRHEPDGTGLSMLFLQHGKTV